MLSEKAKAKIDQAFVEERWRIIELISEIVQMENTAQRGDDLLTSNGHLNYAFERDKANTTAQRGEEWSREAEGMLKVHRYWREEYSENPVAAIIAEFGGIAHRLAFESKRVKEVRPICKRCGQTFDTGTLLQTHECPDQWQGDTTPTTAQTPPIEGVDDEQLRMQAVSLAKLFPDSPGIYYCALECLVAVRDQMRKEVGCSSCRANAIHALSMEGVAKRAEAALAEIAGREKKALEYGAAWHVRGGRCNTGWEEKIHADYLESLKK